MSVASKATITDWISESYAVLKNSMNQFNLARAVGPVIDIEDVFQDVVTDLLSKKPTEVNNSAGYFWTSLHNRANTLGKRKKLGFKNLEKLRTAAEEGNVNTEPNDLLAGYVPSRCTSPDTIVEYIQIKGLMDGLIDKLPDEKHRRILKMLVLDKTHAEIANELGFNSEKRVGVEKSRAQKAAKKLLRTENLMLYQEVLSKE